MLRWPARAVSKQGRRTRLPAVAVIGADGGAHVVKAIFASTEAGEEDVIPDPAGQAMQEKMIVDPKAFEQEAGQMLPG